MFAMPASKVFGLYVDGIPRAFQEKNWRFIVGHLLSQAISGIACAFLMGQFAGDDDDEKKRARAIYSATAAPALGTIPLPYVSNAVTWAVESMIGINTRQYPSANYLPMVDSAAKTTVDIANLIKGGNNWQRLVRDSINTTGYAAGLPAAQANRIMRMIMDEKGIMTGLLGWE
jgi:hypothetical protein